MLHRAQNVSQACGVWLALARGVVHLHDPRALAGRAVAQARRRSRRQLKGYVGRYYYPNGKIRVPTYTYGYSG